MAVCAIPSVGKERVPAAFECGGVTSATGHLVNLGRSAEISRAKQGEFSLSCEKQERKDYCLVLHDGRLPDREQNP